MMNNNHHGAEACSKPVLFAILTELSVHIYLLYDKTRKVLPVIHFFCLLGSWVHLGSASVFVVDLCPPTVYI